MTGALTHPDLLALFLHFTALSLLSIGGAMATAPEMHRYLVVERGWLSESDFTSGVALAQASPGPNVLFVPVLGYQAAGIAGAALALIGILLPSTLLSLSVSRWGADKQHTLGVRAFNSGLAPVSVALMVLAAWVLAQPYIDSSRWWGVALLIAITVIVTLRTRLAPVWLIALGGLAGATGWI